MRTMRGGALLLVAGLVSCGGRAAPPAWQASAARPVALEPAQSPIRAVPGERMAYDLRLAGIRVASFIIAVGEPVEFAGRRVLVAQSGIRAEGVARLVHDVTTEFTSWLDPGTGLPLLTRVVETASADDAAVEEIEVRHHQRADGHVPVWARHPRDGDKLEAQRAPAELLDLHAILFRMRAWQGPPGSRFDADVVRSRYLWRMQWTLAGPETLTTTLGNLPALRIDALARRLGRDGATPLEGPPRQISLWISDDADRVPLRLVARTDYGAITMEIVDYGAGAAGAGP